MHAKSCLPASSSAARPKHKHPAAWLIVPRMLFVTQSWLLCKIFDRLHFLQHCKRGVLALLRTQIVDVCKDALCSEINAVRTSGLSNPTCMFSAGGKFMHFLRWVWKHWGQVSISLAEILQAGTVFFPGATGCKLGPMERTSHCSHAATEKSKLNRWGGCKIKSELFTPLDSWGLARTNGAKLGLLERL